jgi:hypothetical protein
MSTLIALESRPAQVGMGILVINAYGSGLAA